MPQNSSPRKPIEEVFEAKEIQRAGGHKHQFIKDENQSNQKLTAYTCRKCGYGLLIDESIDSINNY